MVAARTSNTASQTVKKDVIETQKLLDQLKQSIMQKHSGGSTKQLPQSEGVGASKFQKGTKKTIRLATLDEISSPRDMKENIDQSNFDVKYPQQHAPHFGGGRISCILEEDTQPINSGSKMKVEDIDATTKVTIDSSQCGKSQSRPNDLKNYSNSKFHILSQNSTQRVAHEYPSNTFLQAGHTKAEQSTSSYYDISEFKLGVSQMQTDEPRLDMTQQNQVQVLMDTYHNLFQRALEITKELKKQQFDNKILGADIDRLCHTLQI